MTFFRVKLSGSGICLPFDDPSGDIIGFFVTRQVRAKSVEEAGILAKRLVLSEWQPGALYAEANKGSSLEPLIEEVWKVGFLVGILQRDFGGYTFYQRDD
ncbi:hypothetical protein [Stenotrophomonas sp. Iso1]|uniref:hypothetical protein n=1 Tax=Stenotrophomonas sp. Iso1 TaxID=2977283 RepID=UPI0022B7A2A7|nr:hypothetical protein [Stenotrophomonas sp. Iso1]